MTKLANRLNKIAPSPTVAVTAKANELKAEGKNIIGLGAGEPDFNTPQHIIDFAHKIMLEGKTKYAPPAGIAELKVAIVQKYKKDNNLNYEPAQINVGCGGKQTIFNLLAATLNEGDEVIIPAPYWVSYPDITSLFDGVPVTVDCGIENDFKITPDQLENAINDKTKWFILNSPSNPTGAAYSEAELKALGDVLEKHPHVLIMSDDIYEKVVYDGFVYKNIAEVCPHLFDRTVNLNGLSKAYCMTGWRVGYAAGPKEIISAMNMLNSQSTTSTSTISQWASVEALTADDSFIEKNNLEFKKRRDETLKLLNDIDGIVCNKPVGAFYLYPCIKDLIGKKTPNGVVINSDEDFVTYLLEEEGVACVHGAAFGLSPYFRISYATSLENLVEACKRIKKACEALI